MGWVGAFAWPWLRVSAMVISAPLFAQVQIPPRIQILLGFALTIAIMPAVGSVPEVDPLSATALLIAVQQILIGVIIGLILTLAMHAAVVAGETFSIAMGLGFATMVDPQGGASVPILSQFLQIFALLLFLAVGGHLMLIELVAVSFTTLPVAATGIGTEALWQVVLFGSQMFVGAVLIGLPAIVVLLTTQLALGVMTRTAPQMNIFSVGL